MQAEQLSMRYDHTCVTLQSCVHAHKYAHWQHTHTHTPVRYRSGKDKGLVQSWIGKGNAPYLACNGFAPPVMLGIQVRFFVGRYMTSTK
eukprot:912219-Pelagomonas_calceolata.AAC.1